MAQDTSGAESPQPRPGLLKDQVRLVRRKNSDRYEIVPIQDRLSFEKGFFIVIRACQLLAQNNDGIILVGLAGPSGAGKTVFTEKILNFMPSIAVISMDNYNDASRIVDGNFDGDFFFDVLSPQLRIFRVTNSGCTSPNCSVQKVRSSPNDFLVRNWSSLKDMMMGNT